MSKGIHTIIDGDTIPWIVAYNHRDRDDTKAAIKNIDDFVRSLLDNTHCSHYVGFLGGTKCHRYEIAKHKPYKGQRPTPPDWYTKWSGPMKAHLRDEWKFQVVNGIEADDAVSIAKYRLDDLDINSIICGGDKDLYQIPGNHYNLRTHKRSYIDELTANRNLFKQILCGDTADNIEGCKGIGPKTANALIDQCLDTFDMAMITMEQFDKKYEGSYGTQLYLETHQLCGLYKDYPELEIEFNEYKKKEVEEDNSITLDDLKDVWG